MDAVETARLKHPRVLISVAEVDPTTVDAFRAELDDAVAQHRRQVELTGARFPLVVDLGWVTYLDHTGAAVLAQAARTVAASGGRMVFVNAAAGTRSVLEAAGLLETVRPQRP